MKLSPGDTIQIILTVGGVPYAKTGLAIDSVALLEELFDDIYLYADEPALGD